MTPWQPTQITTITAVHIETFLGETKADQSTAEGKGRTEAITGIQANFVFTKRNAEGQCHEKRDRITVKIKNREGHDCATEVRVQDNKDGSYKISYFDKESGRCEALVKVSEEQVRGSPFPVPGSEMTGFSCDLDGA